MNIKLTEKEVNNKLVNSKSEKDMKKLFTDLYNSEQNDLLIRVLNSLTYDSNIIYKAMYKASCKLLKRFDRII